MFSTLFLVSLRPSAAVSTRRTRKSAGDCLLYKRGHLSAIVFFFSVWDFFNLKRKETGHTQIEKRSPQSTGPFIQQRAGVLTERMRSEKERERAKRNKTATFSNKKTKKKNSNENVKRNPRKEDEETGWNVVLDRSSLLIKRERAEGGVTGERIEEKRETCHRLIERDIPLSHGATSPLLINIYL